MHRCFPLAWGLCALLLLGCRSNPPYGSYGYGGTEYGGGYPATPGGPYSPPPGTIMGPPSTPSLPPTTLQPSNPSDPGRLTEAPPYTPPIATPPRDPKLVPDPIDAGGNPTRLGNPLDDEADEIKRPTGSTKRPGPNMEALTDDSEDKLSAFGDEDFVEPVRHASSTTEPENQVARSRPNPYAFDHRGYTWLRGVVDYDESDSSWRITYNPTPSEGDAYGGALTLAPDQRLDTLLANEVVYLDGAVDPSQRDRYGKPKYRIKGRVLRLTPKDGE